MKHKLLIFAVVIPNILSLSYFFGIASPVYQSTAQVIVETTLPHSAIGQSSLTSYAPDLVKNAYTLKNIMLSWAGFKAVEQTNPLDSWSSSGDFITAYGGLLDGFSKSDTKLWKYYQNHFDLSVDKNDGILTISYQGYRPKQAQQILRSALSYSRLQINKTGEMVRKSRLLAAEKAVVSAESELTRANKALTNYRKVSHIYNPSMAYANQLHILSGLTLKAAELQSQEAALLQSAPNNKNLAAYQEGSNILLAKIQATRQEALRESNRANLYPVLAANQKIAEKVLELAKITEQKALTEEKSPSFLTAVISPASEPSGSTGPNRLMDSFIVLIITLLIWSFLR